MTKPYWDHPYVIPAAGVIWKLLVQGPPEGVLVADVDAALLAKEVELGRPVLRYKNHAVKYLRHRHQVPVHCAPALHNTRYRMAEAVHVGEDHHRTTSADYSAAVSKFRGYHEDLDAATGPWLELAVTLGNKLGLPSTRILADLGVLDTEPPLFHVNGGTT